MVHLTRSPVYGLRSTVYGLYGVSGGAAQHGDGVQQAPPGGERGAGQEGAGGRGGTRGGQGGEGAAGGRCLWMCVYAIYGYVCICMYVFIIYVCVCIYLFMGIHPFCMYLPSVGWGAEARVGEGGAGTGERSAEPRRVLLAKQTLHTGVQVGIYAFIYGCIYVCIHDFYGCYAFVFNRLSTLVSR
jgi:hypothetical protein